MVTTADDDDAGPVDLREAARRLGVHYMTVYRYVRTGRLPATQDGDRWLVEVADLEQLRPGRADDGARRGRAAPHAYRDRLRARLLAGDEPGAWRVVESVLVSGASPTSVLMDVLAPAMRRVGEGWECGELTVGDEHLATAVAIRLVGRLGPLVTRRGRTRGTVIVACAPGDPHALPAAMLATVLRGAGFAVIELGGNTPAGAIAAAAEHTGERLRTVCVSVSVREQMPAAGEVAAAVRAIPSPPPVLIGGAAVTTADAAVALGADGWAADATGVVAVLSNLGRRSR